MALDEDTTIALAGKVIDALDPILKEMDQLGMNQEEAVLFWFDAACSIAIADGDSDEVKLAKYQLALRRVMWNIKDDIGAVMFQAFLKPLS